ncbi:MAG: (Fe-S)-binding protein [Verrucomicrobia bacterium]|nr:(Fe-S)-binding protein [Verrucomicrobiota bacterium]
MKTTPTRPERFLDYDKSLACIHCGLCLSSCPTYLETGNENDSPRGRIYLMRAVQDGRLPLAGVAVKHFDLCLGCRACEAVCPSGVQYGELLEHTRDHVEKNFARSWFQTFLRRVAIEQIFPFPWRMKLALLPARLLKKLRADKLLPALARDALNLIPADASAAKLPEISPATAQAKRGRVGFIEGCVMQVMFGKTNKASVALLNRAGFDVLTPTEQGCCGALYAHSGRLEQARECARQNIAAFERLELDGIVINAAGCGSTLKEYGALLRDDPEWAGRGKNFSRRVKDLTEWLAAAGSVYGNDAEAETKFATKVTYHDACHLAHPQRITRQPRELLRVIVGENLVELPESDVCCGSAGSYNLTEPEMAARLQRRKTENILRIGAKVVVTTNPGCILQIRAGLQRAGHADVEVLHLADFLERQGRGASKVAEAE